MNEQLQLITTLTMNIFNPINVGYKWTVSRNQQHDHKLNKHSDPLVISLGEKYNDLCTTTYVY